MQNKTETFLVFSHTFNSEFQQTNKTKINHINVNHIKFGFLYISGQSGLLCGPRQGRQGRIGFNNERLVDIDSKNFCVEQKWRTYQSGYTWIIMLEKCGQPDLNIFHLIWIIGTHPNWKKSNSWGLFWSYQLKSTANSAHLLRKWAKWAGLAVLFSW